MRDRKPAVPRQMRWTKNEPVNEEDGWDAGGHVPADPAVFAESERRKKEIEDLKKAAEAQKVKEELAQREAEKQADAARALEEAVRRDGAVISNRGGRTRGTKANMPRKAHFEAMRACLGRL